MLMLQARDKKCHKMFVQVRDQYSFFCHKMFIKVKSDVLEPNLIINSIGDVFFAIKCL